MLGKRQHQQSMYSPWKVMNPASFLATLRVLIFAVLCKGLQGQNPNYNLTVPASVSVQHGLCVHIPCSFTYKQRQRPSPGKLYGYWFQNKDRHLHSFTHESYRHTPGILVATNDKRQELQASVSTRFQLRGEPEEGDCSFSILDARSEDAGDYYFRIEVNSLRWNYITQKLQVLVTELEEPQIWASSAVLSGKEALYACSAPGPCVKIEPTITWATSLRGYTTTDWNQQHINGSWTYGSNFTFTPSLNDQGRELTCWVWYPNIREQVTKSIRLDVADPPKTVKISTNATDRKHVAWCSGEAGGGLESAVVQEGESISLHCHATSRPNPTLSWRKENETLKSTGQGEPCVLLLSSVGKEDAGEYQCWAETAHGSANRTLRLCVLYPPRTMAFSVSQAYRRGRALIQGPPTHVANGSQLMAQEGDRLQLLCTAQSYPPSETSWVKGSRTLERHGPSPDARLEFTHLTVKDAGQYACRVENSLGSVRGIVQLSIEYGPRLSSNQSRSTCWQEDGSLRCNCSLDSWPLPQIQWEADGQTFREDSRRGDPWVTSRARKNTVTSSLSWAAGDLDKSHDIICRGTNHLGTYTIHFLFSPHPKGSHGSLAISGLCGALAAVLLCVLCLGLIKFYKQRKAKASSKADGVEVLNSANGGHQRASEGSLIYSNIPPLGNKLPRSNQPQVVRERIPAPSLRIPSGSIPDPEELNYANVEFSKLKARKPTPMEESVEYTEVKQK
ncbi:sialic acid-binding Ig-like lectin 16 isoform X1 [Paroedura picta]|uniref:sialic acid-binding Ig-like lectin 16 isoform X1 n=1 Tax=Paroedura picta TaxID=143630 RepID=UPI00405694E0